MFNFKDKVVLVTGAGKRLGQVVSLEFAKVGAKVCVSARNIDKLYDTVEKLKSFNATFLPLKLDVLDYDECEAAVKSAIRKFDHIDFLINVASAGRGLVDLREMTAEEIEEDINTTYRGAVYTTKAILDHFIERKSGTIVNVASVGGLSGFPSKASGIYAGSKAGVVRFSERMHAILVSRGVRVSCLVPCSMREEPFDPQFAVSYTDAAKAILFECLEKDDLSFRATILKPERKDS